MVVMLEQQHYTLTKVKKIEFIIKDPFKYPWDFKINILIIITFARTQFSDIG